MTFWPSNEQLPFLLSITGIFFSLLMCF